jgi:hypothetical protein
MAPPLLSSQPHQVLTLCPDVSTETAANTGNPNHAGWRPPAPHNIFAAMDEELNEGGSQPGGGDGRGEFIDSLMDTELYSIGAYFCDEHPELVDEVVARSEAIERSGLEGYAAAAGADVAETFETLLTGLAVRYYKAVAG